MTSVREALRAGLLLAICAAFVAPAARAQYTYGAAQANELWGGPGAKGTGASGSHFDTTVTVSAILAPATGTIDFWAGGTIRASVPFSLPARGVFIVPAPDVLDGAGAFLYHVTSSAAVLAFSETANETANGSYGLGISSFTTADFLNPGDEATGGGAQDSTDPTQSRTNAGILCSPASAQTCQMELAVFSAGALMGTGTLTAPAGGAGQSPLSALVPAASGLSGLGVRVRILQGIAQPYVIRNDNRSSDGTQLPLAVTRGAFSTAPSITSYTVSPGTGCAPLAVTLSWTTTGASKVSISGVTGDLPANGSTTVTLLTSTDLVLTATSSTGATASMPRHVSISPAASVPTPSPAIGQVAIGGTLTGIIPPAPAGTVTASFTQQQSTGSTISLNGGNWVYVGGTVAGTDVVTFTATSACGPVTADLTVTVLPPGAPEIIAFTADPPLGCAPQNVVLSWQTLNAVRVQISGLGYLSPNGAIGTTISSDTVFTLSAKGANGQSSDRTIKVLVDSGIPAPSLSPSSSATLSVGTTTTFKVGNVANLKGLVVSFDQNNSGATLFNQGSDGLPTPSEVFTYQAGSTPNTTDIVRFWYHNGCGWGYSLFTAHVTP